MSDTPKFPSRAAAVTPHDSNTISPSTIYVGTTGDVAVRPEVGGNTVVFVGVPAGSVIPCRVIGVNSTDTTADDLVAVSG